MQSCCLFVFFFYLYEVVSFEIDQIANLARDKNSGRKLLVAYAA